MRIHTQLPASGMKEVTRVSDAWLGTPLSPSPTGSHHNLKSNGGAGGLSILGNADYGVHPYSREAGKKGLPVMTE